MRRFKHADAGTALVWSAADQTQRKKSGGGEGDEKSGAEGSGGQKKIAKRGEELKEEMDNLIDEIDEVLEENAEEFVKNYVQRGGQ